MKARYKWVLAGCAAAFALAQLTNPSRKNPPVVHDFMATNPPPPEIAALLRAACYDCHSHETRWPWYSRIAPISWLIASDVKEGRRHLNLSNWPVNRPGQAVRRLDDMSEEIDYREMPPAKYTAIHADARLTDDQGNVYRVLYGPLPWKLDEGSEGGSSINPGDRPAGRVVRFERPVSAAAALTLVAKPPVKDAPPGRHQVRIPASAWR